MIAVLICQGCSYNTREERGSVTALQGAVGTLVINHILSEGCINHRVEVSLT